MSFYVIIFISLYFLVKKLLEAAFFLIKIKNYFSDM